MKRFLIIICGLFALGLFLMNSVAMAYSLEDIKKDYPNKEIHYESYRSDLGYDVRYRDMNLLTLDNKSGLKVEFHLQEFPNNTKGAFAFVTYYGNEWMLCDSLKIEDGIGAYSLYPTMEPYRNKTNSESLPVFEQLTYFIKNNEDVLQWENAQKITVVGDHCFSDIKVNDPTYNECMSIIRRYIKNTP
ncbi:hypothetical protein [Anaerovibrio sp. RM50]|uniref:hypothetical protein n=1 Tax=Anaerovibrio sp. RM50 TaxID=1200557 RepID=UPI0004840C42|nr:hypothetical protein [Anaerovibrio sp. RM50]